ncbi:ubiquitin-protein ligase E3A-like [Patiria miniata]|uniref:HECT-type E3 ubiquitin transferase n=1 Tax=Patiria miniata TaxID=46514 RepID=A0A913Z8P9_PATMI|nr:ubiquitin-protein ligase E3A-like [Patiria miniata]XP_038048030.1 ubiquitin-protein ligase E3A-like [Patiria miniata]
MSTSPRHILSPGVPDYQGKRASLPYAPNKEELVELRFTRQLSTSHPKLPSNSSNSVDNLVPVERPRSNSLIRIADIKRNLSASNLAALSDSNLSIKKALPLRSYDAPNTSGSAAKRHFVQLVKQYYYQLTEGCGNEECQNRFCRSCKESKRVYCDVAAIISIRLASSQRRYLCQVDNYADRPLPQEVFQPPNGEAKPFLHTLFSTTPFKSLFTTQPPQAEPKRKLSPAVANSHPPNHSTKFPAPAQTGSLINAKPPTGKKGPSPLRKVSSRKGKSKSETGIRGKDGRLNGISDQAGLDDFGSSDSNFSEDHQRLSTAAARDDLRLSHQHSAPNLASGESDATHLLSDDFGSDENFLIHHGRSRSTPVGSYGNLSISSAMSFGSGPPGSLPSMNSSPARLLSSQEALDETDDLRQFERSVSLEMSWDGVGEFSLTHLTLPMLEGAIETYKSSEDPSFLINTIRTVFTSSEALNASFRYEDGNLASIDLSAVRQAYALLWTLTPLDVFLSTMTNALEILLMSLDTTVIQADQINQILILLENPLLETRELLRIFCHVITKLPANTHQALVRALSSYDRKHFQRLLQLIKTYLGSVLRPNHRVHENIICIAKVLSVLHEASTLAESEGKTRHNPEQLATMKDFYSDQLSRNMDYMGEFHKWKLRAQRKEKATASVSHSSTSDSGFSSTSSSSGLSEEQGAHSRAVSGSEMESLLDFPFLLDPSSKVHILHLDAVMQMRQEYQAAILHQARVYQAQKYLLNPNKNALKDSIKAAMCPFLVLEVRRFSLIRDTLAQMRLKRRDLKKPLKIKYVGGGEQGLDMGGLQKEFFQLITEAVFDPKYAMFTVLEESRTLWINGGSLESGDEFELVGSLLGLAIYNGIILDVHFPTAIYKKLHGEVMDIEDLMEIQPSLGRGLKELLAYQEEEEDVENVFCQTFQISYTMMGELVTVDLLPNGSQIAVTNENREEYVRLYIQHILVDSVATQFEAFAHGFHTVCGGSALRLFQAAETEMLVCGSPELDFMALEASATYEDGYSRQHVTIKAFWTIVHSLREEQKRKLLHFITGSDKVPLKGLSSLPIVIQRNGPESDRLPTAMTCFNRLLLPAYNTLEILSQKLLVAIENSKGFGLT